MRIQSHRCISVWYFLEGLPINYTWEKQPVVVDKCLVLLRNRGTHSRDTSVRFYCTKNNKFTDKTRFSTMRRKWKPRTAVAITKETVIEKQVLKKMPVQSTLQLNLEMCFVSNGTIQGRSRLPVGRPCKRPMAQLFHPGAQVQAVLLCIVFSEMQACHRLYTHGC